MVLTMPQDELINDMDNNRPVVGHKGTRSLRDRFKNRLSRMLSRTVAVSEATESQSLQIYIGSNSNSVTATTVDDDETRKFIKCLQVTMRNIARCTTEGSQREEASQDQWDLILVYVSLYIHDAIISLRDVFNHHKGKFDAMITQMMGLDDVDEFGSSLDTDLGDLVITLQQLTNSYDGSVKQQNELIEFAWGLLQRCPAVEVRLQSILGSIISTEICDLVCRISHPLKTHQTIVRTASTFQVFRTVSVHLGSPPSPQVISSHRRTSMPRPQSQILPQSQAIQLRKSASPPHSLALSKCPVYPQGTMMETIRRYLPEEDRGLGLLRLQPSSKQEVALLIGCLLHDVPVPPGSDTYYEFGFSTCLNEEHVRRLGDYYRQLLDTTLAPTVVFQGIVKALEHNTLPGLLRNKSTHDLDKSFPVLTQFLTSQPEKRLSVYRLVQFIRDDDNDEPVPCLKRDYGFNFCTQREQVTKLKALYAEVIAKAGLRKLHNACAFGRLLHHAISVLGFVDPSIRRLLQNDYPSPAVGYENTHGLEKHMMPLFKTSLRG